MKLFSFFLFFFEYSLIQTWDLKSTAAFFMHQQSTLHAMHCLSYEKASSRDCWIHVFQKPVVQYLTTNNDKTHSNPIRKLNLSLHLRISRFSLCSIRTKCEDEKAKESPHLANKNRINKPKEYTKVHEKLHRRRLYDLCALRSRELQGKILIHHVMTDHHARKTTCWWGRYIEKKN